MKDFKNKELRKKKRHLCSNKKKARRNLFFYSKNTKKEFEFDVYGDLISLADSSSKDFFRFRAARSLVEILLIILLKWELQ